MGVLLRLDGRPQTWRDLLARNRARIAAQHILRDLPTDTKQRAEHLAIYAKMMEIARGG